MSCDCWLRQSQTAFSTALQIKSRGKWGEVGTGREDRPGKGEGRQALCQLWVGLGRAGPDPGCLLSLEIRAELLTLLQPTRKSRLEQLFPSGSTGRGQHPLTSRQETLAHCLPTAPSWPGGVTAAPSALLGTCLRRLLSQSRN